MKSYWTNDQTIAVVKSDGSYEYVALASREHFKDIALYLSAELAEACKAPLPVSEWEKYLASLPAPAPPPEPTLTEKLASIGLTIDQLKEALK